jgi:hypothetical protein
MISYEQGDSILTNTLSAGSWQEAVKQFNLEMALRYEPGYKITAVWLLAKEFNNG